MNIPNLITIFRIFLMPLYIYLFYSPMENNYIYAGIIFLLAGISDLLDGYIARNFDMKTDLGAILDPLADKIVVFTILITFTHKKIIPRWILIAMGLKEISLILGGAFLYLGKDNLVMPSDSYGKIATVMFYISILSYMFKVPKKISNTLIITTLILNIIALIHYGKEFLKISDKKDI